LSSMLPIIIGGGVCVVLVCGAVGVWWYYRRLTLVAKQVRSHFSPNSSPHPLTLGFTCKLKPRRSRAWVGRRHFISHELTKREARSRYAVQSKLTTSTALRIAGGSALNLCLLSSAVEQV
jgi:hypothetical protein